MKAKIVLAMVLMISASSSYAGRTYECYRYVNSHPTGGWINIQADSKSEAESKAYDRFKEIGGKVDYAVCH